MPYGIASPRSCPGLMRTGSPVNAQFKGQHEAEYAWFEIASSLPGFSIAAERAARQDPLDACRYGDPALTITLHGRSRGRRQRLAPAFWRALMMIVTRLLPATQRAAAGNQSQAGLRERGDVEVDAVGGDDAHRPRGGREQRDCRGSGRVGDR